MSALIRTVPLCPPRARVGGGPNDVGQPVAPLPCGRSCRGLAGAPEHGLFSVADHARGTSRPTQRRRQVLARWAGLRGALAGGGTGRRRRKGSGAEGGRPRGARHGGINAKEGARKVLILPTNAAISLPSRSTPVIDPVAAARQAQRLGNSSTVELRTLTPSILVRIQVPQPAPFSYLTSVALELGSERNLGVAECKSGSRGVVAVPSAQ